MLRFFSALIWCKAEFAHGCMEEFLSGFTCRKDWANAFPAPISSNMWGNFWTGLIVIIYLSARRVIFLCLGVGVHTPWRGLGVCCLFSELSDGFSKSNILAIICRFWEIQIWLAFQLPSVQWMAHCAAHLLLFKFPCAGRQAHVQVMATWVTVTRRKQMWGSPWGVVFFTLPNGEYHEDFTRWAEEYESP